MADTAASQSLRITPEEASSLTSYIRQKNTAVLTVMFTDIQGFTRITETRGEEYSRDLRRHHDALVVPIIERDGAGMVIKFIGDAVMAVFSEPSAAVAAALAIQSALREFNQTHPDLDDLMVRIGLHMGQVAVEDNLQTDVFGRHVNRASRIESLAAGGQIFMSHAVVDSARGWLGANQHLAWTSHGRYRVKGIDAPVEIYEVCDTRERRAQPPRQARRERGLPRMAVAAGLVLLGGAIAAALLMYRGTEVWLAPPYPQDLRIDGGERVVLDGDESSSQRRVRSEVDIGPHVLHYDVAEAVRYYARVEVERGENFLRPRFEASRLPGLVVRSSGSDAGATEVSREDSFAFFYYDAEGRRHEDTVTLGAAIQSSLPAEGAGPARHAVSWRIARLDEVVDEGTLEAEQSSDAAGATRVGPVVLARQPPLFFYYRYYTLKGTMELTLGASFIEYLPAGQ